MMTQERRRQLRMLLMVVLDAGAIIVAFTLAYLLRFYWEVVPARDTPPASPYFAILTPLIPVWILLFAVHGLYRERLTSLVDEALKVSSAVSVGMMAVLATSFFYRQFSYSRLWVVFAWILSIALVIVVRGSMRFALRVLRAKGIDVGRVLIVGAGEEGVMVARALRAHPEWGQRPVAFADAGRTDPAAELPVLGGPREVLQLVRRCDADRVIVALPPESRAITMEVAALCQEAGVPFAIVPDLYTLAATGADVEVVGRLPMLTLRGNPLDGWEQKAKDAFDILGAFVGVTLLLPVFLVLGLLVWLDRPGPVLYRHKRIGKGGVFFWAWKFRTMIPGAEDSLADDPAVKTAFERAYKLVEDPRVTRLGRWLRRTSLDELPQLLNVLKGEMSLVGPRPIIEEELRKYGPWERRLLCMKPGLTGLWQVLRHEEPDYDRRVALDMYYIDNWSLGLDLQILARTLPAVISGRGAY